MDEWAFLSEVQSTGNGKSQSDNFNCQGPFAQKPVHDRSVEDGLYLGYSTARCVRRKGDHKPRSSASVKKRDAERGNEVERSFQPVKKNAQNLPPRLKSRTVTQRFPS